MKEASSDQPAKGAAPPPTALSYPEFREATAKKGGKLASLGHPKPPAAPPHSAAPPEQRGGLREHLARLRPLPS